MLLAQRHAIAAAIGQDFGQRSVHETELLEIVPCLQAIDHALAARPALDATAAARHLFLVSTGPQSIAAAAPGRDRHRGAVELPLAAQHRAVGLRARRRQSGHAQAVGGFTGIRRVAGAMDAQHAGPR